MKEPRFITAKEEKVYDAVYYIWFAAGWFLLTVIVSVIQDGGFKALKEMLIIGGAGAVLFLGMGAVTWIQGKVAQNERKQIIKNGQAVTGIVTDVASEMVWAGKGRKTPRHRVVVKYQTKNGQEKIWYSPLYRMYPYDYVRLQHECKMYVWGEKCCLAEVPKREQPSLDGMLGKYAFLMSESQKVNDSESVNLYSKKSINEKRQVIKRDVRAKALNRKYRLEDFGGLDETSLEEAKKEWSNLSLKETDQFLCFHSRILRQAKPIGHFEVFLEVRFISKRICDFSKRFAIEQDFEALIKELNFQYTEKDYEFIKSHIQSRMEESAKKHFGRIPVTEVVVELL